MGQAADAADGFVMRCFLIECVRISPKVLKTRHRRIAAAASTKDGYRIDLFRRGLPPIKANGRHGRFEQYPDARVDMAWKSPCHTGMYRDS